MTKVDLFLRIFDFAAMTLMSRSIHLLKGVGGGGSEKNPNNEIIIAHPLDKL